MAELAEHRTAYCFVVQRDGMQGLLPVIEWSREQAKAKVQTLRRDNPGKTFRIVPVRIPNDDLEGINV